VNHDRDYPVISIGLKDPRYPERLKQISGHPKRLYCRGNLDILNSECFAVVGTRMMTSYGKEAVRRIVPGLARHFTIVSGLAIGIDAAAHKAALEAGGPTISVLGGPVDEPAPRTNLALANEILKQGGLLVSEYASGEKVFPSNFAARDRIISGLSRGVLVIEADEKSGSLITAKHAVDQNRDVFTIPGSIFSPKSLGTNKLAQSGAKVVTAVSDIIQDYSMLDLELPLSTANPTEAAILAILKDNGPASVDLVIERTGLEAPRIMAALGTMEIGGLIRRLGDGTYRIDR